MEHITQLLRPGSILARLKCDVHLVLLTALGPYVLFMHLYNSLWYSMFNNNGNLGSMIIYALDVRYVYRMWVLGMSEHLVTDATHSGLKPG